MIIFPDIEIQGGRCVNRIRGKEQEREEYVRKGSLDMFIELKNKEAAVKAYVIRVQMLNNADEHYGVGAWGTWGFVKGIDSWEINVTGGTFSHSWLKDAAINEMKVICKRSGEVVIESASFSLGDGEMKLNASIQIQSQPELTGDYSFEDVEVTDLIGDSYEDWLGGNIDGAGELSGKLNSVEGIKVTTTVNLNGKSKRKSGENTEPESTGGKKDSVLIIRGGNIELLKILQTKDPLNSYSLLRAYKGTLIIENQGKDTQFTLKDIRCGLKDLILMQGKFDYAVRKSESKKEDIDASSLDLKENEINPGGNPSEGIVSEQITDVVRAFSGEIDLGLIPEVFENNIKVLDVYPLDSATLRVWLKIKLNGQLEELTEELADKLFEIMKKDENN